MALRELGLRLHTQVARWRGQVTYRDVIVPLDLEVVPDLVIQQLLRNAYEAPEIEAMLGILRPNDRLLELGSGLGVTSTIAARTVPRGRVLTIEANPNLAHQIRRTHEANRVHNIERWSGVVTESHEPGVVEFHIHELFPESSTRGSSRTTDAISVPRISWSRVIQDFAPSVLLCDIEGGEADLLPKLDLNELRAVIVEVHPGVLTATELRAVFDKLLDDGFTPRVDLWWRGVLVFERT
jgi:FkbM family methyltransferase